MSEHILNMLPVVEEEKPVFEALMPDAVWEYPRRSTVTPEQLAKATVIMGAPIPAHLTHAKNLRWMQSLWMGVDDYVAPGILPDTVTITACVGAYRQTVSEHMLTTLLALCVLFTAMMQFRHRIRNIPLRRCVLLLLAALAAFLWIGRFLSGVHWVTDIVGGTLFSAAAVTLYGACAKPK